MVNTNFPHATTKILAENVDDLNNPPNAVILRSATNPTGLPPGLYGNGCIVIQQNPQSQLYTAQLAFNFASDAIAIRRKHGENKWTEWKYFRATASNSDESENDDMEML